jgi:hypothetical protein
MSGMKEAPWTKRQCSRSASGCEIEHELREAGYDEFTVATDAGSFGWRTVARARAEAGENPPPAGYA